MKLYKILQMDRGIQVKQRNVLIQRTNQGKGLEIRLLCLAAVELDLDAGNDQETYVNERFYICN